LSIKKRQLARSVAILVVRKTITDHP
jgi:hypothetical protein